VKIDPGQSDAFAGLLMPVVRVIKNDGKKKMA
jgi:hypothetical protein